MIGIPWIPVFALRDTGRYLHNDIIRMKDKIALFQKKKDAAANMT